MSIRNVSFAVLTILALAFLVVTFTSTVESAQNDGFSALEQRVSRLEERVAKMERFILQSASQQEPTRTSVPPGRERWRRLKTGLTESQVRSILGEPLRIEGGTFAYWYYSGGSVTFYRGNVDSWNEP